jgi:hypothetical protein
VISADDAADRYQKHGLFWMRNVLSPQDLETLVPAARERFCEVLRGLVIKQVQRTRSGEPLLTRYVEAVERDGGRYDCRHGFGTPPFTSFLRPGGPGELLIPVLQRVLGDDAEVVQIGQVVGMSLEGWVEMLGDDAGDSVIDDVFADQAWHADGLRGVSEGSALTVFMPLCDLTPENGPTQFHLGSHRDGGADVSVAERTKNGTTLFAQAGDAIAFDFRLWHRGLRNAGLVDRPLLYAIVGKPIWREHGKMLPMLDGGSTSLFSGDAVAPVGAGFRLGGATTEGPAAAAAAESAEANPSGPQRAIRKRRCSGQ